MGFNDLFKMLSGYHGGGHHGEHHREHNYGYSDQYGPNTSGQGASAPVVARHCSKCNRSVQADFKFCPFCGANVNPACKDCGAKLPPSATFCPDCGAKI